MNFCRISSCTLSIQRSVSESVSTSSCNQTAWFGLRICNTHSSNDVQTPVTSLFGLNWLTLVICVRTFGFAAAEKLMFANGVVSFIGLVVTPVYFPRLFQSPFLCPCLSSRKNCWNWRNHVSTTKLKMPLLCSKNFVLAPNWTRDQLPLCSVFKKSTSSISSALTFRSGFFVHMYVKMSCKSFDQFFNELFKVMGCKQNVTRTLTNSYPAHD